MSRKRLTNPTHARLSEGRRLAIDEGLLAWEQVREEWQRRSGEDISRQHVQRICGKAERRIRDALASLAADLGLISETPKGRDR